MSKKILASILAAASILSVSAAAFAEDEAESATKDITSGNLTYDVGAKVSLGTIDVTVPTKLDGIILNPYGAGVKTTTADGKKAVNKGAVASPVYEIKNNSTEDGILVMATTAVKKATGVVVIDADLLDAENKPEGWDDAVTVDPTTKAPTSDKVNDGLTWSALTNYDKINLAAKYTDKETKEVTTYVSGGGVSAKQNKNFAVWLSSADAVADAPVADYDPEKCVKFAPKGNTTDTLIAEVAKGKSGFFTVNGALNPNLPKDTEWDETKEGLDLTIVLKILPLPAD